MTRARLFWLAVTAATCSVAMMAATEACSSFGSGDVADASVPDSSVEGGGDALVPPSVDAASANDSGDAGDHDRDAASGRLVVFVTVSTFSDVTTAAAADTKCRGEAAGRLPGTFVAWFPEATLPATSAVDRLVTSKGVTVDGPWVRPDGKRVAASRAALTGTALKPLENPISIDAAGAAATGSVWTGTLADGGTGTVCPGLNPTKGSVTAVGAGWTDFSAFTATCGSSLALYCFQVE